MQEDYKLHPERDPEYYKRLSERAKQRTEKKTEKANELINEAYENACKNLEEFVKSNGYKDLEDFKIKTQYLGVHIINNLERLLNNAKTYASDGINKQKLKESLIEMYNLNVKDFACEEMMDLYNSKKGMEDTGFNTGFEKDRIERLKKDMQDLNIQIPENPYEKKHNETQKDGKNEHTSYSRITNNDGSNPPINQGQRDSSTSLGENSSEQIDNSRITKKISKIIINQGLDKITISRIAQNDISTESQEDYRYNLNFAVEEGKKLIKEEYKEYCRRVADSRFKGWLLRRKLNPAIIAVLQDEGDLSLFENYVKSVKDKTAAEFRVSHLLTASKLEGKNKRIMKRVAKNENKIDGMEVLGLESSKKKALVKGTKKILKNTPTTLQKMGKYTVKYLGKGTKKLIKGLGKLKEAPNNFKKDLKVVFSKDYENEFFDEYEDKEREATSSHDKTGFERD